MRKSLVRAKLDAGKPVIGVKQNFILPWVTEMMGKIGFDFSWMCLEHIPVSLETAVHCATAARAADIDLMMRAARGEDMRIGRMLEGGANGIMLARSDDVQEAKDLVTWAKFPPLGRRGIDAVNADADIGLADFHEYLKWSNRETFLVVQFESQLAVDCCEEIAEIEGVDVLFVGAGDLSLNLGIDSPGLQDDLEKCINRVAKAAERNGKVWGMPAGTPDIVKKRLDQGARFISHGADVILTMHGLLDIREKMSELGFEFHPQT